MARLLRHGAVRLLPFGQEHGLLLIPEKELKTANDVAHARLPRPCVDQAYSRPFFSAVPTAKVMASAKVAANERKAP